MRISMRKTAVAAGIVAAVGLGGYAAADAATGPGSAPAATVSANAPKAPANGVYNYASAQHPVFWGCINTTSGTGGLVGGRFYEYDGPDAAAPNGRYPGCNTWATRVAWDGAGMPESTRTSVAGLAIDGAPGDAGKAGSGGWGWDQAANKPVTIVRVGSAAGLTVTALQAAPVADATITVSFDPADFTFNGAGDASAVCAADAGAAGVQTCTYTDFAHSAKGDTFSFTPERANPAAVVTATVEAGGKTASASFPVQIASVVK